MFGTVSTVSIQLYTRHDGGRFWSSKRGDGRIKFERCKVVIDASGARIYIPA